MSDFWLKNVDSGKRKNSVSRVSKTGSSAEKSEMMFMISIRWPINCGRTYNGYGKTIAFMDTTN